MRLFIFYIPSRGSLSGPHTSCLQAFLAIVSPSRRRQHRGTGQIGSHWRRCICGWCGNWIQNWCHRLTLMKRLWVACHLKPSEPKVTWCSDEFLQLEIRQSPCHPHVRCISWQHWYLGQLDAYMHTGWTRWQGRLPGPFFFFVKLRKHFPLLIYHKNWHLHRWIPLLPSLKPDFGVILSTKSNEWGVGGGCRNMGQQHLVCCPVGLVRL